MTELAKQKCKPCEGGVAPLSPQQVQPLLKSLKGWIIESYSLTGVKASDIPDRPAGNLDNVFVESVAALHE